MLKGRKQHDLTQEKHFLFIKDFQNHGYKNETQSWQQANLRRNTQREIRKKKQENRRVLLPQFTFSPSPFCDSQIPFLKPETHGPLPSHKWKIFPSFSRLDLPSSYLNKKRTTSFPFSLTKKQIESSCFFVQTSYLFLFFYPLLLLSFSRKMASSLTVQLSLKPTPSSFFFFSFIARDNVWKHFEQSWHPDRNSKWGAPTLARRWDFTGTGRGIAGILGASGLTWRCVGKGYCSYFHSPSCPWIHHIHVVDGSW